MTAEEKKSVAFFIDLASGWARGGYSPGKREYCFFDDSDADYGGAAIGGHEEGAPSAHRAPNPLVMAVGDISDSGEDALLLDKMLGSIGLSRGSNCLIANVIEYEGMLQSMKPRFILCLGEPASQALLHNAEPVEKLRGRLIDNKANGMTIPLIATYHPNDLLRNEALKRPCWDDLKMLRAAIGPVESGVE